MRRIVAALLAMAVLADGLMLLAAAGVSVLILTEPSNRLFVPVFAPLAIGVVVLANYLMRRIVVGLYPDHAARLGWKRAGSAVATLVLGLAALGLARLLTTPIHWQ